MTTGEQPEQLLATARDAINYGLQHTPDGSTGRDFLGALWTELNSGLLRDGWPIHRMLELLCDDMQHRKVMIVSTPDRAAKERLAQTHEFLTAEGYVQGEDGNWKRREAQQQPSGGFERSTTVMPP